MGKPSKGDSHDALPPKKRRFVDEYLKDLNATRAATAAGYAKNGKENVASTYGCDLLKKPAVKAAVDAAISARRARVQVDQDQVLTELKRLAFVDIGKVFNQNGELIPFCDIDEDTRRAINSIQVDSEAKPGRDAVDGWVTKFKLSDKLKALELLMRHSGMLKDKVEISASESFAALVMASMKGGGK